MLFGWITVLVILTLLVCITKCYAHKLLFIPTSVPPSFFHENNIFTPNGISMLFHDKGPDTPIIIYSHGNAGNIYNRYFYDDYFPNHSLLLYDYRGFGKTPGVSDTNSILEDGDCVYQYIKNLHPNRKIILWGESMGSAVAWYLASRYNVDGLMITAGYSRLQDVVDDITTYPLGKILSWLVFLPDNTIHVDYVKCPVLILHAKDDDLIKFYHAQNMMREGFKLIPTKGGHNFTIERYMPDINTFLENISNHQIAYF